jgi:hypothetical protein
VYKIFFTLFIRLSYKNVIIKDVHFTHNIDYNVRIWIKYFLLYSLFLQNFVVCVGCTKALDDDDFLRGYGVS